MWDIPWMRRGKVWDIPVWYIHIVMDLLNALLGNGLINTLQYVHAAIGRML
jgi:hypothetical protein